jgi:hypothetical protein
VYICMNCNTKTEKWRPWLYERKKKNIPQEETAVEHDPVDSQELNMTDEAVPLVSPSGESPQDDFIVFAEADSETTSISSSEDPDSDVKHHLSHWSHDLVLCTFSEATSLPVSLEGRVIGVEEKLHELQGSMTKLETQLEKLEQLMRTAHVALGELAYLIGE